MASSGDESTARFGLLSVVPGRCQPGICAASFFIAVFSRLVSPVALPWRAISAAMERPRMR